ncbi:hypothetical protein fHeYen901_168 [Yersinia phage fHe-Yen9-01]|uniref:Uncharacterized protein n=1 Tax=Yersinia phage fHe-Yen9-01 TaxID=1965363 RepID=A0A1V0DXR6_9CAUD|nr:hypothetical protein KNT60_gp167 [Yersinia phage fHe-Yen9-01]ARB05941.1 hypothetical protein fHeYen901_168 [Yersinia phage fHe-Yen9-01]
MKTYVEFLSEAKKKLTDEQTELGMVYLQTGGNQGSFAGVIKKHPIFKKAAKDHKNGALGLFDDAMRYGTQIKKEKFGK